LAVVSHCRFNLWRFAVWVVFLHHNWLLSIVSFGLGLVVVENLNFYLFLLSNSVFPLPLVLKTLLFKSFEVLSVFLFLPLLLKDIIFDKRVICGIVMGRILWRVLLSGRNWVRDCIWADVSILLWNHLLFSKASYSLMIATIGEEPFVFLILQFVLLELSFIDEIVLPWALLGRRVPRLGCRFILF
jgi:hypothetical protein